MLNFRFIMTLSLNSNTTESRRVDKGGAMSVNAPPPHGPKRSAWKEPKTKEKNAKEESFLLICQHTQHKQCRKHIRGC